MPLKPALSRERVFPQIEGVSAPLWKFFGFLFFAKAAERGNRGSHTCTRTRPASSAEVGPGYLLEKDESGCHLPFLLFVDYQTLSAVSRAAIAGEEGWREGGREEIPGAVATGQECFKTGAAYKLFSLSGNNLCNCWLPWLPTQGPEKGEDEGEHARERHHFA